MTQLLILTLSIFQLMEAGFGFPLEGTETSPEEMSGLLEGDMVLSEEQIRMLNGNTRVGQTSRLRFWNKTGQHVTVPYIIDEESGYSECSAQLKSSNIK